MCVLRIGGGHVKSSTKRLLNFKMSKILNVYIPPPSGREQHCLSVEMLKKRKKKKDHIISQDSFYSSP